MKKTNVKIDVTGLSAREAKMIANTVIKTITAVDAATNETVELSIDQSVRN